jgi:hypothetical protein
MSAARPPADRRVRPMDVFRDSSENRRQADILTKRYGRNCGPSRSCRPRRVSALHFTLQGLSLRIRRRVPAWFLFRCCPPTCSPAWRPPSATAHESPGGALSPRLHARADAGPGARTDEVGRTKQTAVSRLRELGRRLRNLLPMAVRQCPATTGSSTCHLGLPNSGRAVAPRSSRAGAGHVSQAFVRQATPRCSVRR